MTWLLGEELPVLLDDRFPLPLARPFTSRQAERCGVSRHTLSRLVAEGLVRRVLKGVYVASQVNDDLLLRAHALSLVVPPDCVAVDWTACWLHTGVQAPGAHEQVPPLSVFRFAGSGRLRNTICVSGERTLDRDDTTVVGGVAVTTPLRTAFDLGRFAPRDWALAGMDALCRASGLSAAELVAGVERFARQRGVVQLRQLAPLVDGRSESPGESVLRLRWLDLSSLPAPEPQVRILGPDGREIYRIDLGVRELRFGVEYDGEENHTSDEDVENDVRRRRDLLERFGWRVVPVTRANVFGARRDVERILIEGVRAARRRLGQLVG